MRDIYLNPTIAKLAAHLGAAAAPRAAGRDAGRSRSASRPTSNTTAAAPCSSCSMSATALLGALAAQSQAAIGPTRRSTTRPSSICAAWPSRVAVLRRSDRHPDRGQVAADRHAGRRRRSRSGACATSASGWCKTLVQSAPMAAVRRHAALQRLSAAARRQDRARRRHRRRGSCRSAPTCSRSATTPSCARTRSCSATRRSPNYIHTGSITIGDNAFVGEASVLDIDTVMERRHPARARVVAAERPARPRRQALSRLARAGDARPTIARSSA